MDESRSHGAVDPGGQPKRQENSAGAKRGPEAQERVDRWGEVHTVTWDETTGRWAGEVQGIGLGGEPLRAWWPKEALTPWPEPLPAPSDAHGASGASTIERASIQEDEIPF